MVIGMPSSSDLRRDEGESHFHDFKYRHTSTPQLFSLEHRLCAESLLNSC